MTGEPLPQRFADYRDRHRGSTILVCGCGVSLATLERPERFLTIGVNDIGRRFTPDYLVVVNEPRQFEPERYRYVELTQAKAVFTQLPRLDLPQTRIVRFRLGRRGAQRADPDTLNYSNASPYIAVNLARYLGATRIGLIGVDFADDHFFGPTGRHPLASQLAQIDREFGELAASCRAEGIGLVNLSATSRLQSLPRARLADWELEAPSLAQEKRTRVFFVNYRFLSCGTVFHSGLRDAAIELDVVHEEADWDDPLLPEKVERFAPDLLFVVHGRRFAQRWADRFHDLRSAVWLLDEPYEVDSSAAYARRFSFVFVNDPATLSRHANAHYLPVCFNPRLHFVGPSERRYRTGFVGGGNPSREKAFAALAARGALDYVVGGPWRDERLKALSLGANCPPERTAQLYKETSIVLNAFRDRHHFNKSGLAATSMNPRIYEALACGALVVSESRPEIGDRLPALPTFRNLDEAPALVEGLLSDPIEIERRLAECLASLSHDTYADRLRSVLEIAMEPSARLRRGAGEKSAPREENRAKTEATPDSESLPVRSATNGALAFDGEWDDFGGVASLDGAGEIRLEAVSSLQPGAERGLVSRARYRALQLEFEVWIGAGAVFLAKVSQQDRLDQTTNSYHILCEPRRAYVARHNHIFGIVPIARETWRRVRLSAIAGQVSVHVEGTLAHRARDSLLDGGYAFLGAKGGAVRLRRIRLFQPNEEARDGTEKKTKVTAGAGIGDAPAISYCIAVLRPVYARLIIQDLIEKTTAPYEILVWLNAEDSELQTFLDGLMRSGRPIRIVGRSSDNLGMRAYRSLFEQARYELITQIDDDVLCVSPRIAERGAAIFRSHPRVRQIVADVWQDEFTTGARPPMQSFHLVDAADGLYDGPIDGWFSIYHRSILPELLAIPYAPYCGIGGAIRQRLQRTGLHALLCTDIKVFHAIGPEYASYFGVLEFEIAKYRRLGRHDIVKWYETAPIPSRAVLDRNVANIRASLAALNSAGK